MFVHDDPITLPLNPLFPQALLLALTQFRGPLGNTGFPATLHSAYPANHPCWGEPAFNAFQPGPSAWISPLLFFHLPRREAPSLLFSFPCLPQELCSSELSAHSKTVVPSMPSCRPDCHPASAFKTAPFWIFKWSDLHLSGSSGSQGLEA